MTASPLIAMPSGSRPLPASETILRTYGSLNEVSPLLVTGATLDERNRLEYRKRWGNRFFLAQLASHPEGFEFAHTVDDDVIPVILLSPPDQVAIRDCGIWKRELRDEKEHGPAQYTSEWYQNYLRNRRLPSYFLTLEHLAMNGDMEETANLGILSQVLEDRRIVARTMHDTLTITLDYLDARYPETPLNTTSLGRYRHVSTDKLKFGLTRRFPAILYLQPGHPILIDKAVNTYNIILHHKPYTVQGVRDEISTKLVPERQVQASYILRDDSEMQRSPLPSIDTARRASLVRAAKRNGGLVNPGSDIPAGVVGTWEWLEPNVDGPRASALGIKEPTELMEFLEDGRLMKGFGPFAGPIAVFSPVEDYLNPTVQPLVAGNWQFLTEESRRRAQKLCDDDDHGLGQLDAVDAGDVWRIRETIISKLTPGEDFDDPTVEIDLVWIPQTDEDKNAAQDAAEDDSCDDDAALVNPSDQSGVTGPLPGDRDQGYGLDSHTGLAHDPYNRGENVQTAQNGKPMYQTRMIHGKRITLDRSRAKSNLGEQVHQEWIYSKHGKLVQFPKAGDVDWSDSASVRELNRWREQTCKREGWALKRGNIKPPYTKGQRDWLFEKIKEAGDRRPSMGCPKLTEVFNREFQTTGPTIRDRAGVQAQCRRLIDEFNANDGQQATHRKPGRPRKSEPSTPATVADSANAAVPSSAIREVTA